MFLKFSRILNVISKFSLSWKLRERVPILILKGRIPTVPEIVRMLKRTSESLDSQNSTKNCNSRQSVPHSVHELVPQLPWNGKGGHPKDPRRAFQSLGHKMMSQNKNFSSKFCFLTEAIFNYSQAGFYRPARPFWQLVRVFGVLSRFLKAEGGN